MNKRNVWHLYLRQQIYLALERGTANSEAVHFRVAAARNSFLNRSTVDGNDDDDEDDDYT